MSNRSFLIVDDELDMCWVLENILKRRGLEPVRATTARDALRLMNQEGPFATAFLDAKLPDLDGLELARKIQQIDPAIPIVMISGYFYRDDAAVQKALANNLIRGFIAKPFQHDEIKETIDTVAGLES